MNVAQVETKTTQNQVITHEVTGTGKVMGTRAERFRRAKVEQSLCAGRTECEKGMRC